MCDNIVADCTRCGRHVYENQSHVMVVHVGGDRRFFHAGCEPSITHRSDLVEDKIRTANEPYSG
jgi:hypothetical protein